MSECPYPPIADQTLPGKLTLLPNEYVVLVAKQAARFLSYKRLAVTTQRAITSQHGTYLIKHERIVYLRDIVNAVYK